jgi:hypothetical protein
MKRSIAGQASRHMCRRADFVREKRIKGFSLSAYLVKRPAPE